jgi:Xaa-Pro aminopeptidase
VTLDTVFSRSTYLERLARVRQSMQQRGIEAVVVSPSSDLLYLCGYEAPALERPTLLVVTVDSEPVLLVPRLERARVPMVTADIATLIAWEEGDDPYDAAAKVLGGAQHIAVGDQMWALHLMELQRRLADARFYGASKVISPVRAVKEPAELELLQRAAEAADKVALRLGEIVRVGMTEREAAAAISNALLDEGNDAVGFVIVGSGPNSASPHHNPSDRTISQGDVVVCDFGGVRCGYRSDVTRTMVFESTPEGFDLAYDAVRAAQQKAVEAAASGTVASEIDRAARSILAEAGYDQFFIHRTGHGIGLDPHEEPYIAEESETIIESSMCFSIEPGIYLEGAWGIRIEDIVVATDSGGLRLNTVSTEAICL